MVYNRKHSKHCSFFGFYFQKTKQNSENVVNETNEVKIEKPKCYDMPIDSVENPTNEEKTTNNDNPTNDPITFKIGL